MERCCLNLSGKENPGCWVDIRKLHSEMNPRGGKAEEAALSEFLKNFYQYAKLVESKDNDVRLNTQTYSQLKRNGLPWPTPDKIRDADFFTSLKEAYDIVLPTMKGMKYVPIPSLRKVICERLKIPEDVFDEKLRRLPMTYGNRTLLFCQPMNRQPVGRGLEVGKNYYYYLAIY